MKITWIGQGGLLIECEGLTIMVDPYLSESVPKKRNMPIETKLFDVSPDVIVCTHNHLDHTDPETLAHYFKRDKKINVLCPKGALDEICKMGYVNHNYVRFNRHTEYTIQNVLFKAVKAEHSDIHPIGFILSAEGKNIYITGDTLYNTEIFGDIDVPVDVMFICVNGEGNNMNMADAARFADKIGAKKVIPVHWGMFDHIDPNDFADLCENVKIPRLYEVMEL